MRTSLRNAGKPEKQLDLLLATRNPNKTREFDELLGQEFRVRDLTPYPGIPAIREIGSSLEENAKIKALAVSRIFPTDFVFADDSGLEVDALAGAPGIFSARYAGKKATDRQNVDKLLVNMRGELNRAARFHCVIALARSGKWLATFQGAVEGTLADQARGPGGFGYDPVFVPEGFDKTFAELGAERKNQISHRARAVQELRRYLRSANAL
jgi:XTP/dITP diphosphohydrolase